MSRTSAGADDGPQPSPPTSSSGWIRDPSVELAVDVALDRAVLLTLDALHDRAVRALTAGEGDLDEAIHDARKAMKRIRAMARLVRRDLDHGMFEKVNSGVRDAGRILARVRDTAATAATIADLAAADEYPAMQSALEDLARRLDRLHVGSSSAAAAVARRAATALEAARPGAELVSGVVDSFSVIGDGIGRSYGKGARAMERARRDGTHRAFHEWRKRVKDLQYQLEAIAARDPDRIGYLVEEIDRLAGVLGIHNDLAVVMDAVDANPDLLGPSDERPAVLGHLEEIQHRLRQQALDIGEVVYAPSTRTFVGDLHDYWDRRHRP